MEDNALPVIAKRPPLKECFRSKRGLRPADQADEAISDVILVR
jgi:hypothetical protein